MEMNQLNYPVNKSQNIERWRKYREGIKLHKEVRKCELERMINLANPRVDDLILEIGSGNGYLTFPIASKIKEGEIITADISSEGLQEILEVNNNELPIKTYLYPKEKSWSHEFPKVFYNNFDKIVTLATYHHFDTRRNDTGEIGRTRFLNQAYDVLKDGGNIILGDVSGNTKTQKYFDAIDNPICFYPDGHPHNFQTNIEIKHILEEVGFKKVYSQVEEVPWQFNSKKQAMNFLNQIHNAKCKPEKSLEIAEELLGLRQIDENKFELGWDLMFIKAEK